MNSISWDSGTGAGNAFASTDQALNTHGAIASMAVNSFDAASTITASTVACVATLQGTLTTAQLNTVTIGRIAMHYNTTANITTSSTFLWGGVDQQSIAKTSEFSLVTQLQVSFVST